MISIILYNLRDVLIIDVAFEMMIGGSLLGKLLFFHMCLYIACALNAQKAIVSISMSYAHATPSLEATHMYSVLFKIY